MGWQSKQHQRDGCKPTQRVQQRNEQKSRQPWRLNQKESVQRTGDQDQFSGSMELVSPLAFRVSQ